MMKGYQLKISIEGKDLVVWRRIKIPASMSFFHLHLAIQELFGWMSYHSHKFIIDALHLSILDTETEEKIPDLKKSVDEIIFLSSYLEKDLAFTYVYDYDVYWEHHILVEKEIEMSEPYIVLVDWQEDNLAEDVENVEGYLQILKKANDEQDPECETMRGWLESQHEDFEEAFVKEILSFIIVPGQDGPKELSSKTSKEMNRLVMKTHKLLKHIEIIDLSLIRIKHEDRDILIGFNRMEDDITLQFYDDELSYLQGVEYTNSLTQGNLYANNLCVILTEEFIPINCWKTTDDNCMVKRLRTGFLPKDVEEEEAKKVIAILKDFIAILTQWKRPLPSYNTNEYLDAVWNDESWCLTKQPIRLHPEFPFQNLSEKKINTLRNECQSVNETLKIDLIALPCEKSTDGELDIILVVETEGENFENESVTLLHHSLKSIYTETLHTLYDYFLDFESIPDKIIVNNENLKKMLTPICDALLITLQLEPFLTEMEEEFFDSFENNDMQMMDMLANMSPDEFYDLMSSMNEEELLQFQQFLQQYLDVSDYDELFDIEAPKKTFDA